MTFFRHFCLKSDFEILVITDNPEISNHKVPYEYYVVNRGHLWRRITLTRLYKLGHTVGHFVCPEIKNEEIISAVERFNPQAVFTVAGSWSWMALMAKRFARKLNVPLIGSFNDWWFYNVIRFEWLDTALDRQFRKFYKECDLAICTSDGMKKELGVHRNAVIVYPTGGHLGSKETARQQNIKFQIAFAGNLGDWYGKMLEMLIRASSDPGISFKIFGSNPSWSAGFNEILQSSASFEGHVPFDVLQEKMRSVDALLLIMGFDKGIAQIEKTSFKTKFLDYLTFQKPIVVWGPSYCSAVTVAKEFDSAEICTSEDPSDLLRILVDLKDKPLRQALLISNARKMYAQRFNPDTIHAVLTRSIRSLVVNW